MNFAKREDGASAVEFGLIAPILILLVFACIEFGFILFTYADAQNVARNIGRQLSVNEITTAQAQAQVTSSLPRWVAGSATVTVTQTDATDPSNNSFVVDISFPALKATPTNVLGWTYSSLTLHADATFHQEPTS